MFVYILNTSQFPLIKCIDVDTRLVILYPPLITKKDIFAGFEALFEQLSRRSLDVQMTFSRCPVVSESNSNVLKAKLILPMLMMIHLP